MEKATRHHFFNHGKADSTKYEEGNCHWCQIRAFEKHKRIPVTIVNTVDQTIIDPDFRFVNKSVLAKEVPVAEEAFRAGCRCEDDHDCMYGDCDCLDEMEAESDEDGSGGFGRQRKRFSYHSHGDKAGLLRSRLLDSVAPIYECHSGCSCSARCPNRVVERGRTVPLQIFRTDDGRGWGVRCPVDIRKGQFVDKYVGEVLTGAQADQRRQASDVARRKDIYLFALDKFSDPESPDPLLREPPLEVDGEYVSGPTRFVNHSCEPNMRIFARVGDHADKHLHDLALFAIKDIAKGEELTFDYVNNLQEMERDAHDQSRIGDMTKCLCGAPRCRGFLW